MVTISNWWGIFFSFGIPIIFMMLGCYIAGIQEVEEKHKKRVAQRQL